MWNSGTQSQTKIRNRPPSTKGRVFPCIWKHFLFLLKIAEYETMRKDVNRSAYTRRILEIVGNIKKQKEEINKVKQFSICWIYSRFALISVHQAQSLVTKPRSSYSTNQIQNVINKRRKTRRTKSRFPALQPGIWLVSPWVLTGSVWNWKLLWLA